MFRVEVNTAGGPIDSWSGNALTFETQKEADQYAFDLMLRWTAVRDYRILEIVGSGGDVVRFSTRDNDELDPPREPRI